MTAVLLTALGVPREVVLRDYLLSNDLHRAEYTKLRTNLVKAGVVRDPELLRPILEREPYLSHRGFEEADRGFGSFAGFLADGLGIAPGCSATCGAACSTTGKTGSQRRRPGPSLRSRNQATRENSTASPA